MKRIISCVGLALGVAGAAIPASAVQPDTAAFADQQSHGRYRQDLGGDDQIGFVFAVLVIDEDDRAPGAHGRQGGGHACGKIGRRTGSTALELLL